MVSTYKYLTYRNLITVDTSDTTKNTLQEKKTLKFAIFKILNIKPLLID